MVSEQPDNIPNGTCSICSGGIDDVKRVGHFRGADAKDGWWYSGRCPTCDADYRLVIHKGVACTWQLAAPDATELMTRVETEELTRQSARFSQYTTLSSNWSAFVARIRSGDEVWRYGVQSDSLAGYAIVRQGVPVCSHVCPLPQSACLKDIDGDNAQTH